MENKDDYQAELFTNRLRKKYKELRKWARKNRISCYRLYDRDIPEVPLSLDLYEFLPENISSPIECAKFISLQNEKLSANDSTVEIEIKSRTYAVLYLYERPYEKDAGEEGIWLGKMAEASSDVLGIDVSHIFTKQRKKQKGLSQYEKDENSAVKTGIVQEQGQLFKIDLSSYLDTGLFFDHRPLRSSVREECGGKRVLNLFCYTGSFSVYSAMGGAAFVESVDMSNTYLNWAKDNMSLNGFTDKKRFVFTRGDCIQILKDKAADINKSAGLAEAYVGQISNSSCSTKDALGYDIIILDPPTFSNSKKTFNVLDINRDWSSLCADCISLLNDGGILYFSTNSTKLSFDENLLREKLGNDVDIQCFDKTSSSIPKDFEGTKCHKLFKIEKLA